MLFELISEISVHLFVLFNIIPNTVCGLSEPTDSVV